jgi:hypothetical protein
MAILINGTIMVFVGIVLVIYASDFSSRSNTRRNMWERCGGYLFLAGIALWGVAFSA